MFKLRKVGDMAFRGVELRRFHATFFSQLDYNRLRFDLGTLLLVLFVPVTAWWQAVGSLLEASTVYHYRFLGGQRIRQGTAG